MSFVGTVIEEVESDADQLEQKAEPIEEQIIAVLTDHLDSTAWVTPTASISTGTGTPAASRTCPTCPRAFADSARRGRQNAQQQCDASAS